jgi:hypothetical protein
MTKHTVTFTPGPDTLTDCFTVTDADDKTLAEGTIGFDGVSVDLACGLTDKEVRELVEEAEAAELDDWADKAGAGR